MVAANRNREEGREEILKYDKGAVFLVFLLTCFAAGMGLLEYCMNFYAQYGVVYY